MNAESVLLTWSAPDADSVRVLSRSGADAFDVDTTLTNPTTPSAVTRLALKQSEQREYVLQSFRGGQLSPFSRRATLRPHDPLRLGEVSFVAADQVQLLFNGPLDPSRSETKFWLLSNAQTVTPAYRNEAVVLAIGPGIRDSIAWSGLRDAEGTPIADSVVAIDPAVAPGNQFYLASWTLRPPRSVDVLFSAPVTTASATSPANYTVSPFGQVDSVEPLDDAGLEFRITLSGLAVGPTGLDAYLTVDGVEALDGSLIDNDGGVISLSEAANGLADAYVFPNPVQPGQNRLYVGGLPNEAEIRVFGTNGVHVATLLEVDNDGGIAWDLRDEAGALVPSGIYLLHVRLEGEPPILLKAAIIR